MATAIYLVLLGATLLGAAYFDRLRIQDADARFRVDLPVSIGGEDWTVRFDSNARFEQGVIASRPWMTLLAIVTLELLIYATVLMDLRNRRVLLKSKRDLEQSNHDVRSLTSLTQLLQSCAQELETYTIFATVMGDLFTTEDGAFYILGTSEKEMQLACRWGREGMVTSEV